MNKMKYLLLGMIMFQVKIFATEQHKAEPFSYWGFTAGYHLDLGSLKVHSDAADEIDKAGTIVSTGAYALRRQERHHIHLGLGLSYADATGNNDARGLKQSIALLGIYADGGWTYHLGSHIFVGSYLRTVMGKGAWFDDGAQRLDLSFNLMPTLEYLWDKPSTQTRFQLSWARSINIHERVAQSFLLGFSLTFDKIVMPIEPPSLNGLDLKRKEIANRAQAPSHGKSVLPIASTNTGIPGSLAVHFRDGSSELTAEALEKLGALTQVLFRYKTAWKRIYLIRYQDPMKSATKDRELSEARLKNISVYLEAEGLPRSRIRTTTVSSRQAGSEVDTMDAKDNRVDLELRDIQGRDAWELRKALDTLMTKPN